MTSRTSPHGSVHLHWYASRALGVRRALQVYTPPGYEKARKRYPTLYLFHGSGDNEATWVAHGRAHWILDNLIAQGRAEPMVVVMLDGTRCRSAGAGNRGRHRRPQPQHHRVPERPARRRPAAGRIDLPGPSRSRPPRHHRPVDGRRPIPGHRADSPRPVRLGRRHEQRGIRARNHPRLGARRSEENQRPAEAPLVRLRKGRLPPPAEPAIPPAARRTRHPPRIPRDPPATTAGRSGARTSPISRRASSADPRHR
jgi:hypothetical protein